MPPGNQSGLELVEFPICSELLLQEHTGCDDGFTFFISKVVPQYWLPDVFGKHLLDFAPEFIDGLILAIALDALINSKSECMLRRSKWRYERTVYRAF